MSALSGPVNRRGRPKIQKLEEHHWWKDGMFVIDDDGREFVPHMTDTEFCWFFRYGMTAQVSHMGKSQGIRKFLHEFVNGRVDSYHFLIVAGSCNDNCVNPTHTVAMDRITFMRAAAQLHRANVDNSNAPLYEKSYTDKFGDLVVVGHEAARLYWLLLNTGRIMELWDWDKDFPSWMRDYGLRAPENALVNMAMLQMLRDESWTVDRIRTHIGYPIEENIGKIRQDWEDFHEGLRSFM